MVNIGANDLLFLFLSFGGKAAVMTYKYKLDASIDVTALERAVKSAVEAFPLYGLMPVIDKDGHIMMQQDQDPLPVYPDDGEVACLGSSETNGYLFRVTYIDDQITITVSHALGDGRGIMNFTVTLLYHYLVNTGHDIDPQGMIYTQEDIGDPAVTESMIDKLEKVDVSEPFEKKAVLEPFFAPEEKIYMGTPDTKRFIISWDHSVFKAKIKSEGATPVVFMHDLIAGAMYEYYDLKDETISACVPVDLRDKLGSRAQTNFTVNVDIPIDKELLQLPVNERYRRLKEDLDEKAGIDRIAASFEGLKPFLDMVSSLSVNDMDKLGQTSDIVHTSKPDRSYLLTNFGLLKLPEDIKRYVSDADVCLTDLESTPVYMMLTYGNKGMLLIGQNYEESGLAEKISHKLKAAGIDNKLEDKGLIRQDDVDISKFKHI
ncbi:hypothetical protein [Butyrivibrio sp.]|uniref:hypothetical protein n=1 Tax=Butyrivibrio sp. TaxID=28121 RepID=UPI0025BCFEF2|nr:hypothetical protein [Butyrivibrio sp.]MBQ9304149.1 hypothetical protein [Butyrivibrio sp.]